MSLCETAVEVAEQEAARQLSGQLIELAEKISDEIVATAEEYESDE